MKSNFFTASKLAMALFVCLFVNFSVLLKAGEPVSGLEIMVGASSGGKQFTTKTDKNGKFSIPNLTKGTYSVRVRSAAGDDANPITPLKNITPNAPKSIDTTKHTVGSPNKPPPPPPPPAPDKKFIPMQSAPAFITIEVKNSTKTTNGKPSGMPIRRPLRLTKDWHPVMSVIVDADGGIVEGTVVK